MASFSSSVLLVSTKISPNLSSIVGAKLVLSCRDLLGFHIDLTGLHAALAAWQSWLTGGGEMIGLSLSEVTSFCIHSERNTDKASFLKQLKSWPSLAAKINEAQTSDSFTNHVLDRFSRHRLITGKVASLGEDTQPVMKQLIEQSTKQGPKQEDSHPN